MWNVAVVVVVFVIVVVVVICFMFNHFSTGGEDVWVSILMFGPNLLRCDERSSGLISSHGRPGLWSEGIGGITERRLWQRMWLRLWECEWLWLWEYVLLWLCV